VVFGGDFYGQLNASLLGDNGANIITGTAADESLIGAAGNDTLDGGAGNDVLIGGEGDDTLVFDAADTLRVDGGNGKDTLQLTNGDSIDLSALNNFADPLTDFANPLTNIERLDMQTDTGANNIKIGVDDLLALSDSINTIEVIGGTNDAIQISGAFADSGVDFVDGGTTFDVYTVTGNNAELLIDQDITVSTF
jgi:hypothetical protein